MICTEAPQQLGTDIIVDAKGKIGGLGKLTGAELQGKVSAITQDFLAKYPNADKILLAKLMMNATCEALRSSPSISDAEALAEITKVNAMILQLVNQKVSADMRSRASRTDYAKWPLGQPMLLKVFKDRRTTLHLFEPPCDFVVYISDILDDGKDNGLYRIAPPDRTLTAKAFEHFEHTFAKDDPLVLAAIDSTTLVSRGGDSHEPAGANDRIALKHLVDTGEFVGRLFVRPTMESCETLYYIDYSS